MTKHANGAASRARGDTIAPGVVSEHAPGDKAATGLIRGGNQVQPPCPVCHGTGRYLYSLTGDLLPVSQQTVCRCCDGTGRQLFRRTPQVRAQIEAGIRGGIESKREAGPTDKTLLALSHPRYEQYVQACYERHMKPTTGLSWKRLRSKYRDRPEYVGRPGPRRKRPPRVGQNEGSN